MRSLLVWCIILLSVGLAAAVTYPTITTDAPPTPNAVCPSGYAALVNTTNPLAWYACLDLDLDGTYNWSVISPTYAAGGTNTEVQWNQGGALQGSKALTFLVGGALVGIDFDVDGHPEIYCSGAYCYDDVDGNGTPDFYVDSTGIAYAAKFQTFDSTTATVAASDGVYINTDTDENGTGKAWFDINGDDTTDVTIGEGTFFVAEQEGTSHGGGTWSGIGLGSYEGSNAGEAMCKVLTSPPSSGSQSAIPFGTAERTGMVCTADANDASGNKGATWAYEFNGTGDPRNSYWRTLIGAEESAPSPRSLQLCEEAVWDFDRDGIVDIDQVTGSIEYNHICGADFIRWESPFFGTDGVVSAVPGQYAFSFINLARATADDKTRDVDLYINHGGADYPSIGCGYGNKSVEFKAAYGTNYPRTTKLDSVCLEAIVQDTPESNTQISGNWTFDTPNFWPDGSSYTGSDPDPVKFNKGLYVYSDIDGTAPRPAAQVNRAWVGGAGTGVFKSRINLWDFPGETGKDTNSDGTLDTWAGDISANDTSSLYTGTGQFFGADTIITAGATEDPDWEYTYPNDVIRSLVLRGWEDSDGDGTVDTDDSDYGFIENNFGPLKNTLYAYKGRLEQDADGTLSNSSVYPRPMSGAVAYHFDLDNDDTADSTDVCLRDGGVDADCDGTAETFTDTALLFSDGDPTEGSTTYFSFGGQPPNATEAYVIIPAVSAGAITAISCRVNAAPGAGKSWTITLMVEATPSTEIICPITNPTTTCTDTGSHSISANDRISLRVAPASGPDAAAQLGCSLKMEM